MKDFIKNNAALVVGVALPLLLVLFFLLVDAVAYHAAPPPRFSAVFVTNYQPGDASRGYWVGVEEQKLVIKILKKSREDYMMPVLFLFDHETQLTRRLNLDLKTAPVGKVRSAELDKLNSMKILSQSVSPDGYYFDNRSLGHDGGFFGALFGWGGTGRSRYILRNGAKSVPIVPPQQIYDFDFVGWVQE